MGLGQKSYLKSEIRNEVKSVRGAQLNYIIEYFKKYGDGSFEICPGCSMGSYNNSDSLREDIIVTEKKKS
jgi:hypothetical protein